MPMVSPMASCALKPPEASAASAVPTMAPVGDRGAAVGVHAERGELERAADGEAEVHVADDHAGDGAGDEGPAGVDERGSEGVVDAERRPQGQDQGLEHGLPP
jgi:hypothetical protein